MLRFLFNAPPSPPLFFVLVQVLLFPLPPDYCTTIVLFVYSASVAAAFSGIHRSLPPVQYVMLFGAAVVPLSCTEIKEKALFQMEHE